MDMLHVLAATAARTLSSAQSLAILSMCSVGVHSAQLV
jgi:hypothetical protein